MAEAKEELAKQEVLTSDDVSFDDIRPCRDDEVSAELKKIVSDKTVINSILRFRYPILSKHFSFFLTPLVRSYLKKSVAGIHSVRDFQKRVSDFMDHVISTTTDGVEYVGFDKFDRNQGYLFISNHRDISLDPAFIDKALYANNLDTVRIAIGDNLLRMPAATSLMRLNKSFIVKRSISSPREKLKALMHLSSYIGLSIKEGHSIWIAQREGRAKDGDDRTEDAVLKMIGLYGRQLKQDFGEYMRSLNIVPVSITYEYDPNDIAKARELAERERNNGEYHKEEFEDIDTITLGIRGYKGRVKIVAGDPIKTGFDDAAELASIIDSFVWKNYEMFPSALVSAGVTEGLKAEDVEKFKQHIAQAPSELRERILAMYSRPYSNRKNIVE